MTDREVLDKISEFFIMEYNINPLCSPLKFRIEHMLKVLKELETIDHKLVFMFMALKFMDRR